MTPDTLTAPAELPLTESQDYQVQMVRLGDLFVDRTVRGLQRDEQKPWSKKIATGFDWARFNENPPKVSARPDGRYHIMDGQHEIAAARLAGYGPDTKVRVHVWHGLTHQQEAEKFSHNRDRHAVRPLALFDSDVARGAPDAVALDALLAEYGWKAGSSGRHGNFAAVTTLRAASIDVARQVVETITKAWGLSPHGPHRLIVAALRAFYAKYPHAKTERMATVLQRTTPIDVQNQARGDKREVVVHRLQVMYDSGLRNGRLEQPS